ncbi:DUF4785 family protein [Actinomadura litoris]|uniref:DUF4785 family protein n=1 Tax=Actinomadura litoris TaxID=2678616 RepID=UPI001FA709FD|nr:DUF4785 family protein [Actinomadura litoris]
MTGQWRYALHDLLTGAQISEHVPFKIESYSTMLAEPGTLTAVLPLGDPAIRSMRPRELIQPRRTALVLFRDEQPVWDGIIWNRRRKRSDNTLTVGASEVRSYYARRQLRPELGYGSAKTLAYTGADLFTVFRGILADAADLTYLGLRPGDLGVEVDEGQMSGVLIDRRDSGSDNGAYHGFEFASHAQLLDDLAGTDPGCEWRIEPYLDGDRVLRRRLILGSPTIGTPDGSPNMATLEYPGDVLDYEWPDDGEQSANYVAVLGTGDGDNLKWAQAYNDAELMAGYPLLETTTSHKNDSSLTVLAERATADLASLAGDRTVPTLDLNGYAPITPGDYVRARLADEDWWPGSGIVPFEATVRVIGKTVRPGTRERTTLAIEEPRVAA